MTTCKTDKDTSPKDRDAFEKFMDDSSAVQLNVYRLKLQDRIGVVIAVVAVAIALLVSGMILVGWP